MKRWLWFVLTLVCIFTSNTMLVQPRELPSDSAWLLQELSRDEAPPDVKRQGPLFVTPTRLAVGENVAVTVEANSSMVPRALVMIDREGNWLETRFESSSALRTQVFEIPLDGLTGEYRFWLSDESQTPQSGLGVITIEVYDPVPGNLRRASPLEVVQKFYEAALSGEIELALACLGDELALEEQMLAALQDPPTVRMIRSEVPYEEPQRPEQLALRCLVRIELQVSYDQNEPWFAFWGERSVSRYFVLLHSAEGWRIASWADQWPEEFASARPPQRVQATSANQASLPVTASGASEEGANAGSNAETEAIDTAADEVTSYEATDPANVAIDEAASGEIADASAENDVEIGEEIIEVLPETKAPVVITP